MKKREFLAICDMWFQTYYAARRAAEAMATAFDGHGAKYSADDEEDLRRIIAVCVKADELIHKSVDRIFEEI